MGAGDEGTDEDGVELGEKWWKEEFWEYSGGMISSLTAPDSCKNCNVWRISGTVRKENVS